MSTATATGEGRSTDSALARSTRRARCSTLGLTAGWLALGAAVLLAHRSPATGYELSIYAATPTGVWVGVGAAGLVALLVAVQPGLPGHLRTTALALGGGAGFSVAALPVLRGYYFVGAGDALTHLGWASDLAVGRLDPTTFLYPAVHSVAVFVARVAGVEMALAVQYAVLAFVLCFLLFVPLCARAVVGGGSAPGTGSSSAPGAGSGSTTSVAGTVAPVAGTFAAATLLPVNNVSTHLFAHPTTQAVLFLPVVLYLVVRYVTTPVPEAAAGRIPTVAGRPVATPLGVLLALLTVGIVLVHPQVGLTVAVAFAAVAALQAVARRRWPAGPEARHRSLTGQAAFALAVVVLWASGNPRVRGTVGAVVDRLRGDVAVANEVAQRGGSLAELGSSLPALFVRLFGATAVVGLLAACLALAAFAGRPRGQPERRALVRYLAVVAVPAFGGFVVFFGLSVSTQAFRYTAFVTAVATVLAAVALAMLAAGLVRRRHGRVARAVLVVTFAVLVPMATTTAFASPFVYQASPGVTEQQVAGYAAAFDRGADDVPYAGVRSGPIRYVHAVYGTRPVQRDAVRVPGQTASVPGEAFGPRLTERFEVPRYVPVTDRDLAREVALYDGLRYDRAGFRTLRTTPGIHRVRSNGDFRLYLVESADGT